MKTIIRKTLTPEVSRRLAKIKTAKLTDADVDKLMAVLLPPIKKLFADIQLKYKADAKAKYDKSGARERFARSFEPSIALLDQSLDQLKNAKADRIAAPDNQEGQDIAKLLSAETVICYPCFELSDLLTSREILTYFAPFAQKPTLSEKDIEIIRNNLTRTDVFCLRDATDEMAMQDALVRKIGECCLAGARVMKKLKARDEALYWLDVFDALEVRAKRYNYAMSAVEAETLTANFRAAFHRHARILRYESI